MSPEEIEKRSRVQKRGRFSEPASDVNDNKKTETINALNADEENTVPRQLTIYDILKNE